MNRLAWKSVSIIALLLCAGSLASMVPTNWHLGRGYALMSRTSRPLSAALPWRSLRLASLLALAAVGAGAAIAFARPRLTREPRRRVLWLAARGSSASHIARRTGLAQDAVRAFLRPAPAPRATIAGRQALPSGRNVRSAEPRRRALQPPKWLKRRSTTALGRAMFARHSGC
ncbi:MAG: hypothetical protein ACRENS_03005 [Candidatus Eiseniibacteriota bacterium]